MAKLKPEFQKSQTIKLYFPSVNRRYSVTREKLCQMMEEGKLDKKYHQMFEPETQTPKTVVPDAKIDAKEAAKNAAKNK